MIVGLCGPAHSGKDQTYQFVAQTVARLDDTLNVRRDAFADRLKISAARALGIGGTAQDCLDFCNWLKEKGEISITEKDTVDHSEYGYVTGREYLQFYGTEAHRDVFGFDFWVNAVIPPGYVSPPNEILVVTDVRFDNEAKAVKDHGGVIWKIDRPAVIEESDHASEAGVSMEYIDFILVNSGTLDEFEVTVETITTVMLDSMKVHAHG